MSEVKDVVNMSPLELDAHIAQLETELQELQEEYKTEQLEDIKILQQIAEINLAVRNMEHNIDGMKIEMDTLKRNRNPFRKRIIELESDMRINGSKLRKAKAVFFSDKNKV